MPSSADEYLSLEINQKLIKTKCHVLYHIIREMYQPSSAIYRSPESGDGLADCLFDQEAGSRAEKEVRPFGRHNPARGTLAVRALGGHKSNESNFLKARPTNFLT